MVVTLGGDADTDADADAMRRDAMARMMKTGVDVTCPVVCHLLSRSLSRSPKSFAIIKTTYGKVIIDAVPVVNRADHRADHRRRSPRNGTGT